MRKMFINLMSFFGAFAISLPIAFGQYNYMSRLYVAETNPVYIPASSAATARPGYKLIFSDEFEYTSASQLTVGVGAKWNYYLGTSSATDMTNPSAHISFPTNDVGTKSLRITVDKVVSPPTGSPDWASAMIMSKKHLMFGYYEARCKYSAGRGSWPAFWLFGNSGVHPLCLDSDDLNDPAVAGSYNEIDIFENFPDKSDVRNMTYNAHTWQYNCGLSFVSNSYDEHLSDLQPTTTHYTGDIDLEDQYHIYGMEFKGDSVLFYLDGKLVGFTNDASMVLKLADVAMWVTLNGAVDPSLVDYTTPNSMSFDIDYVRVYKKNPTISVTSNTCGTSSYSTGLTVQFPNLLQYPTGTTISYSWAITGGSPATATGPSVTVTRTSPAPFSATVTATQIHTEFDGSTLTQTETYQGTFNYPDNVFSNVFSIGAPQCTGGNIKITASAITSPPGGLWQLWNTTVGGGISGAALQSGYGSSITFSSLAEGTTYAITRGVWDACTPWNFVQKNFTVKMSDFTVSQITCPSNNLEITCTALSNNAGGFEWHLYPSDAAGNIPIGTLPVKRFTNPATYNNLTPGTYYKIYQGIYGGCVSPWTTSSKVIYAPDYFLNPDYNGLTFNSNPNPYYNVTLSLPVWISPVHHWAVYNTNAAGDPLSQIGASQYGSSANFAPPAYFLNDGTTYLFVHAVYGGCSNWYWRGKLASNSFKNGEYVTEIHDIELTEDQIRQLQSLSGLNEPSLHLFPNPATEYLNIQTTGFCEDASIEVFDLNGKVVAKLNNSGTGEQQLDCSGFTQGTYFVRVFDGSKEKTEKWVKQ